MIDMNLKIKSILIIFILISSLLIINLNLNAINLDNEMNNSYTSRSTKRVTDESFNWGEIKVISESIIGENNNLGFSERPKIAVENEKIYVVWSDDSNLYGSGIDFDIFFRYFDGFKWSEIQVISEPVNGKNYNIGASTYPDIAVNNGKIYVVWGDTNNTNNAGADGDIFFRCNITSSGWEDIQVISEPIYNKSYNTGGAGYPSIDVNDNKIHVVWYDSNETKSSGSDWDIFYRCNLTGSYWENIQVISEPILGQDYNVRLSQYPDIAVENGKTYVVWQDQNNTNGADMDVDIFYRCNLTGSSWESIQVISEPIDGYGLNIGQSEYPSISVNNGNIYVVWQDNNNTNNASTDEDIFFRCNLTGSKWESVQVISEPIFGKYFNSNAYRPKITAKNDKVYVVWFSRNNTNNASSEPNEDIHYRCNITGHKWNDIHVISEPILNKDISIGESYNPDIAVFNDKNYFVWENTNNTNNASTDTDIFFRSISLRLILDSPRVSPTSGNTSTNFYFTIEYFNFYNTPPSEIIVNIDDIEYPMLESHQSDTNFKDGKKYFFKINNLNFGLHFYKFKASDSQVTISTGSFENLNVYNTPPKITTINNSTAFEDIYYEVDYDYEDIDNLNIGQSVFFSDFSTNAHWLKFDYNTGILNGTPMNEDVGEYWVSISVTDGEFTDNRNFTLTVTNINDPPKIITNNTEITTEDEYYEVDYEAIDIDTLENNLIWKIISNATWLKINPSTGLLYGTPINENVGKYWVNITVTDNEYLDYTNFTLTVININDPPRIITKDVTTAFEDEYYELYYEAEDVDNTLSELFWDINTNAKWLNYDISTAVINGTPKNDDIGEYWVYVSVSDNKDIDFTNFTLNVINTNDPPIIITKDKNNVTVGEWYSVDYEAQDIDPGSITFTWSIVTNAGDWINIDPITGELTGVPTENDIGNYWINVSVTDGEGGWDYYNFTLKVQKSPTQEKDEPESSFISTETFYWFVWIIIIIVILISVIIILILRKQKKEIIHILEKREIEIIQTVKAELLQTTPSHISLPSETSIEGKVTLPAQPVVIERLPPKPADQTQPIKAIGTPPMPQQYQLPKAALSKEQQLNLLRERFLKGEVTEEIYNKLRSEIESSPDKDISLTEEEYQNQSGEENQETSDLDGKSTEMEN